MRGYAVALAILVAACGADDDAPRDAGTDGGPAADAAATRDASTAPDAGSEDDGGTTEAPPIQPYPDCGLAGPEARQVAESPPPASVTAGAAIDVSLTFANCSGSTWVAAEDAAAIGVKLGSAMPHDNGRWGPGRVALDGDVPTDHSVRIDFTVTAPMTNGNHPYQWQLVDETIRWIDAPSTAHVVEVTGGTEPEMHVFHPREEWQTGAEPVTGPSLAPLELRYITLHYAGAPLDVDGADDVYQDADTAQILRNQQSYYLSSRGYSLGYNSAVSIDGAEWEIRGEDIRAASNGCQDVNRPAYTILVLLPETGSTPPPAQIAGIRSTVARVRALAAAAGNTTELVINGHRDVRPVCGGGTACPGDVIYGMIGAGTFEP